MSHHPFVGSVVFILHFPICISSKTVALGFPQCFSLWIDENQFCKRVKYLSSGFKGAAGFLVSINCSICGGNATIAPF